ncbi:hypothetical protein H0H92_005400 [Tricholoma furcatifolium]|nr:hypothetical protein H0H92_005400 [Tricholoma furcatifolium]
MTFTVSRLLDLRGHCAQLKILRKTHSLAAKKSPGRTGLSRDTNKWPVQSHLLPKLQDGLRDISGKPSFSVHVDNRLVRLWYHGANKENRLLPPNTRGFLYYHHVPNTPPASAELRFRVITPKDDGLSLSSGSDLLLPDSFRPWSCPLFRLAGAERYQPLWDFVCQHYLDDATARWLQENARNKHILHRSTQMLHYLEQPFIVDVRCFQLDLGIITPFGSGRASLRDLMIERRHGKGLMHNGHVMLRFERSSLPEHANSRVLVLRVLKILQPIQFDEASPSASHPLVTMKEGELLERRKPSGRSSRVHTINLDAVNVTNDHKALNFLLLDSESKVQ